MAINVFAQKLHHTCLMQCCYTIYASTQTNDNLEQEMLYCTTENDHILSQLFISTINRKLHYPRKSHNFIFLLNQPDIASANDSTIYYYCIIYFNKHIEPYKSTISLINVPA